MPTWFHLVSILLFGLMFNTSSGQIAFSDLNVPQATNEARDSNKLVFVDVMADWCAPCKQMEHTTFQDSSLSNLVNTHFVAVRLNLDHDSLGIRRHYTVSEYPTILIINPKNQEVLLRIVGYKPASILMGDLRFALGLVKQD